MVWLRFLTIIAALATLPYFYFQLEPLWSALLWQSAFLLINLVNLTILIYHIRPVKLNEDQTHLHKTVFSGLQPHEMLKLLSLSEQRVAKPGQRIMSKGAKKDSLYLVTKGVCAVRDCGVCVGVVKPGQFMGEMSFISDEPVSAHVEAETVVRYYEWKRSTLTALFSKSGLYKTYLFGLFGMQMATRLRATNQRLVAA